MTIPMSTLIAIATARRPQQRRRCWTCEHEICELGYPAYAPDPAEGEFQGCKANGDPWKSGASCLKWKAACAIPTIQEVR